MGVGGWRGAHAGKQKKRTSLHQRQMFGKEHVLEFLSGDGDFFGVGSVGSWVGGK